VLRARLCFGMMHRAIGIGAYLNRSAGKLCRSCC
jgi:hypothetical protein